LWWTKAVTAIPVISITPTSLRVNKQEKLLWRPQIQLIFVHTWTAWK
jgi:hypothetical protein